MVKRVPWNLTLFSYGLNDRKMVPFSRTRPPDSDFFSLLSSWLPPYPKPKAALIHGFHELISPFRKYFPIKGMSPKRTNMYMYPWHFSECITCTSSSGIFWSDLRFAHLISSIYSSLSLFTRDMFSLLISGSKGISILHSNLWLGCILLLQMLVSASLNFDVNKIKVQYFIFTEFIYTNYCL